MSNPNQLFLLADHIKLSLLERKRAQQLNLDGDDGAGYPQDGHISRSLDQFRDGLASLQQEQARLESSGDASYVSAQTPPVGPEGREGGIMAALLPANLSLPPNFRPPAS